MEKNKKIKLSGFTLIELLAVIVVLAIIALIATPIVLNIIRSAKDSANKRSVELYCSAVKNAVVMKSLEMEVPSGTYTTLDSHKFIINNEEMIIDYEGNDVNCTLEIEENGNIKLTNCKVDNVSVDYGCNNGEVEVVENTDNTSTDLSCFEYQNRYEITGYTMTEENKEVCQDYGDLDNGISVSKIESEYGTGSWSKFCNNEKVGDVGIVEIFINKYGITLDDAYEFLEALNIITLEKEAITDEIEITKYNCGGTISLNEEYESILSKTGSEMNPVIPDTIDGKSVTSIGSFSFSAVDSTDDCFESITENNKQGIYSITIPSSVTKIGFSAFNSNVLTILTIPSTVDEIGSYAFSSNKLNSLTISDGVTSIGSYTFAFNQIQSVTIPDSVTKLGARAFMDTGLSSIVLSNNLSVINIATFEYNELTSVDIPEGIVKIYKDSFDGNQLATVSLPSTLQYIGANGFEGDLITFNIDMTELEFNNIEKSQYWCESNYTLNYLK